jgi:sugar lactone lactonase YvrE
LYISDTLNHRIRRVDFALDVVETVVGDGTIGSGGDGGPGTAAQLNNPRDLEFGPDGRLYFSDELNNRVRAWDPVTGTIRTVAGTGPPGFSGDGGAAVAAQLNRPTGLEFDPEGRLYIADSFNHRIRRMRPEVD